MLHRMSHPHFVEGNLIILYALSMQHEGRSTGAIPDHVKERIRVCIDLYRLIMTSKPDRDNTVVLVIASDASNFSVRKMLTEAGIDEKQVLITSSPKSPEQTFDYVLEYTKNRLNPPYIYFIGSFWQKDIYDSIASSKMKDYQMRFEGAPDHRPTNDVVNEKAQNMPKKRIESYKRKLKGKAVDMVLNYIFPDDRKG